MKKNWCVLALLFSGFMAGMAQAQELEINVEIPKLSVAEYHKPYLAVWLEDEQGTHVANIALLYDQKMRNNEGEKWLKDLRQWWRKSGRSLTFPIDGVTGATKGPGVHHFTFALPQTLSAGNYQLRIEAAREVGGRELITLPVTLPIKKLLEIKEQGKNELGAVSLSVKP